MNIEEDLRQYIGEILLTQGSPAAPRDDEALIASGLIDSLGLIKLLAFVQQRWQVDLLASCGPEDFESIATLAAAIRRHGRA